MNCNYFEGSLLFKFQSHISEISICHWYVGRNSTTYFCRITGRSRGRKEGISFNIFMLFFFLFCQQPPGGNHWHRTGGTDRATEKKATQKVKKMNKFLSRFSPNLVLNEFFKTLILLFVLLQIQYYWFQHFSNELKPMQGQTLHIDNLYTSGQHPTMKYRAQPLLINCVFNKYSLYPPGGSILLLKRMGCIQFESPMWIRKDIEGIIF